MLRNRNKKQSLFVESLEERSRHLRSTRFSSKSEDCKLELEQTASMMNLGKWSRKVVYFWTQLTTSESHLDTIRSSSSDGVAITAKIFGKLSLTSRNLFDCNLYKFGNYRSGDIPVPLRTARQQDSFELQDLDRW